MSHHALQRLSEELRAPCQGPHLPVSELAVDEPWRGQHRVHWLPARRPPVDAGDAVLQRRHQVPLGRGRRDVAARVRHAAGGAGLGQGRGLAGAAARAAMSADDFTRRMPGSFFPSPPCVSRLMSAPSSAAPPALGRAKPAEKGSASLSRSSCCVADFCARRTSALTDVSHWSSPLRMRRTGSLFCALCRMLSAFLLASLRLLLNTCTSRAVGSETATPEDSVLMCFMTRPCINAERGHHFRPLIPEAGQPSRGFKAAVAARLCWSNTHGGPSMNKSPS